MIDDGSKWRKELARAYREEELNRLSRCGSKWLLPIIIFVSIAIVLIVLGVSFRINYVSSLNG